MTYDAYKYKIEQASLELRAQLHIRNCNKCLCYNSINNEYHQYWAWALMQRLREIVIFRTNSTKDVIFCFLM